MQFIDLAAQQQQRLADGRSLREAIDGRMAAVLDHGQYILGPEVAELEVFEAEGAARGRIGAALTQRLRAAGISSTPQLAPGNTSVYAQYTIQVANRPAVQEALKQRGIPTAVHYPTLLCQQPALAGCSSCAQHCPEVCACPVAQAASERVLSLPMHPYLSEADQERIAVAVVEAMAEVASQVA